MNSLRRTLSATLLTILFCAVPIYAADHADAPNNAYDKATDLADLYFFLDPNDNTQVVMIMTLGGFIVPGENVNFGLFDPNVRYSFLIENTGDARPDQFIDVRFEQRRPPAAQVARITLPDGRTFTAPTTVPSHTAEVAPPPAITTEGNVQFWAGEADDPFFFDIPGFARFVGSVLAGSPNPALFARGRDSFAGYNVLAIGFRMPASMIRGSAGEVVGLSAVCQRRQHQTLLSDGSIVGRGRWITADREGVPAVNVALIPFGRKNAYNTASTTDDADLDFANEIIGTLRALGTNDQNINTLAQVAVLNGDMLRLNTFTPNTGPGGGNNAGAGFPNGRRPADDVIDTLMFFIANQNRIGDAVNANEVPFRDQFPFLAPPHQPRQPGVIDDGTRN